MKKYERHIVILVIVTVAIVLIVASAESFTAETVEMEPGDTLTVTCNGAFDEQFYQVDPGVWDVLCMESSNTTGGPTATPTAIPPTATPVPPTATPEPGAHNTTVWHGPVGNTHEHGAPPPAWLPTSGPCANVAFEQMAIGREAHWFYNGYHAVTSNGVEFYIVNHIAPTIPGRSHGDHDETKLVLDTSGNVSCWQEIADYSADPGNPTGPINVFIKDCGGNGPVGPIILVDCGLGSESWYQEPGASWCDNTTHINGVWEDVAGNNHGDGGSRHVEISCYPERLPGPGAIHVAPTLAQDCLIPSYGPPCAFKAVSPFAFDYTEPSVAGPN